MACTLIDDPAMLFGGLRFNACNNKSGARLLSSVSDFAQSPDGHEAGVMRNRAFRNLFKN
jgi:hypothetical protein